MIDNNFFVNVGQKDITKNISNDKEFRTTKNNDYKDTWNNEVKNTQRKDFSEDVKFKPISKDNSKDFSRVLLEKKDNKSNFNENTKSELDNKKFNDVNKINEIKKSNVENSVKEVEEIISNEENFQGNKIEGDAMQEIVALLNQIINSPEIKALMPVKLEDPMRVSNENVLEVESSLLGLNNSNVKNSDVNTLDISNLGKNLESLQNNKEALSLANTILETLNSKNVEGILSSENVDEIKNVLQGLVEKIFKSDTSLLNNVEGTEEISKLNESISTFKDFKSIKDIKSNNKIDATSEDVNDDTVNDDIKSILTDLKSSLSSDRNTTIKPSQTSDMDKTRSAPGAITASDDEDKVLAKILGNESFGGSLGRQDSMINRLNVKGPDVINEPMVVNKETMDADIIKNVKFMMKNQVSELKVKIYPKELGEMTIKLLSEEGILKADIKAVSKETYNLLNSNINDIKKSLEQQNIKIHEVNIGLYSDDTTYHSGENSSDEMFKNNENNKNRQGKDSTGNSRFINDDFEEEANIYDDSSVDLLV